MKGFDRIQNGLILLFASQHLFAGTADLPYYIDESLTPVWAKQLPDDSIHSISGFALTNQLGEPFTSKQALGKIRVVNFFFATCPGVCPTTMRNLKKVQQQIQTQEVLILSFSITPNIDSPERLAAYADVNDINAVSWQLLTGDEDQITALARDGFFAVLKRNVRESALVHTEKAYLLDQESHIRGIYNATSPADIMRLIEDMRTLQEDL